MPLALQVDCPTGPPTTHILRDLEEDAHTTRATIPCPNPPPPRLWRLGASRGQRLWRLGRGWEVLASSPCPRPPDCLSWQSLAIAIGSSTAAIGGLKTWQVPV